MRFSEDELKWYHRQMLIDGWGREGQAKLRNSVWDGSKMEFRIFKASKDPDCLTCKDKKQNNLL